MLPVKSAMGTSSGSTLWRGTTYHYSVRTGNQASPDATFKAYPTDMLRVAVDADWQGKPDLPGFISDDVHLLLTAGDNISNTHRLCGPGNKECIKPYAELIDRYPALFRSTPFMPVLGNHDKEVRPRGSKPPDYPVYDIDATAFRRFFELPGDEWKWHFDIPVFGIREKYQGARSDVLDELDETLRDHRDHRSPLGRRRRFIVPARRGDALHLGGAKARFQKR